MEKKDFIIGENIIAEIYKYDDQGKEYIRKVRGKVIQADRKSTRLNSSH